MLLERGLGSVWLEGEISNLARPASGHWYFSLKDESAQVRCAMFRNRSMLVRFPVKDGARVLARGRVSLYEARGEFQVVIDHLEEAGEGALRRRFEELKRKLLAEGLFEAAQKKPLPTPAPSHRRDHVADRRCAARHPARPAAPLPGRAGAGLSRCGAGRSGTARNRAGAATRGCTSRVRRADPGPRRRLARGPAGVQRGIRGARDLRLRAFRSSAAWATRPTSRSPTSSPTSARRRPPARPNAACRTARNTCARSARSSATWSQAVRRKLPSLRQALQQWERSLHRSHPRARLQQHAQRLDELEQRLQRAVRARLERARVAPVECGKPSSVAAVPARRIAPLKQRLDVAQRRLPAAVQRRLQVARERFERSMRTLQRRQPAGDARARLRDRHGCRRRTSSPTRLRSRRAHRSTARVARGSVRATVTDVFASDASRSRTEEESEAKAMTNERARLHARARPNATGFTPGFVAPSRRTWRVLASAARDRMSLGFAAHLRRALQTTSCCRATRACPAASRSSISVRAPNRPAPFFTASTARRSCAPRTAGRRSSAFRSRPSPADRLSSS